MPKSYPYFPFYPDDFLSDSAVRRMRSPAIGVYAVLLCIAWRSDPPGTLPNDDEAIRDWVRFDGDDEEWECIKTQFMRAFVVGSDGRLHQKRMELEYQKMVGNSNKAIQLNQARWDGVQSRRDGVQSRSPESESRAGVREDKTQESIEKEKEKEKEKKKRPRVFSPNIEAIFSLGMDCLKDAGHKIPETPAAIIKAKDVIRLMIEVDKHGRPEIERAWTFIRNDTGDGAKWPGWRSVVQSFAGFREKWPKFWQQAFRSGNESKPKKSEAAKETLKSPVACGACDWHGTYADLKGKAECPACHYAWTCYNSDTQALIEASGVAKQEGV